MELATANGTANGHITANHQILLFTAEHYRVSTKQILSRTKLAHIVWARHVAMWLTRHVTGQSYQAIALENNRLDHATVMHAVKHVEKRRGAYPAIKQDTDQLKAMVNKLLAPAPSDRSAMSAPK